MNTFKNTKITIIGGGNIGQAIASGFLNSGEFNGNKITISDRDENNIPDILKKQVNICTENIAAIKDSKYIIIAVKPHGFAKVAEQIKDSLQPGQIILSVVSDIRIETIKDLLETNNSVFRLMPNTSIAIKESITCIASEKETNNNTLNDVINMFNCVGKTMIINEDLMNAATVLTGCGIAFVLRFLRAFMQGGIEIGFDAKAAQFITAQTLKGAAELILSTGNHPEHEIDRVTTPMGVTISGLNEMEFNGFSSSLIKGVLASYNKMK